MGKSSHISKGILVLVFAMLLSFGALKAVADQHEHMGHEMHGEANEEVVLVGEVVDLYCYMKHPSMGQGLEHAKCAKSCIRKGLPIGFLSNGEAYVIIGKEHESAKDLVVDFAGIQSRLTGMLIEHDGVKAIEFIKIEELTPESDN